LDKVPAEWWEESVLPKLNFLERERVQKKLAERADVVDAKQKEVEKFSSRKDEYFAEQQQLVQEAVAQENNQIYGHLDVMTQQLPVARYMEMPENASKEDHARITAHNATVSEMENHFQSALNARDPKERTEVAMAAVASIYFAKEIEALQQQLASANGQAAKFAKELEAVRSAGRAPSSRSGTRKPNEGADPMKLSDEDAIEQGLLAAEGI
jgi:nicotinic acid phosphoribosyltransferase